MEEAFKAMGKLVAQVAECRGFGREGWIFIFLMFLFLGSGVHFGYGGILFVQGFGGQAQHQQAWW